MKFFLPVAALVCFVLCLAWGQGQPAPTTQSATAAAPSFPDADADTRRAKAVIDQGIQALGGQAYLNIRDREMQGRGYGFHHGTPTSLGVVFWSFSEFPDKERLEFTPERDVAELFVGNKGYEITFKGVHPVEQKDLDDYLRRRHYSLDAVLRTWVNEPGVILLYEGNAIAAQHPAQKVTLINSKNESVSLFFDSDTHLPIKKSFEWRDPVDRQKNLEEEVYENYRAVSGIMVPYNVTRYFNGDMSNQRFINSAAFNQRLDQAMFDPNSGYSPTKPKSKH